MIDYPYYINNNERFIRTEIDEFNKLKLYDKRDGVVSVNQGDTIDLKYVVKDYCNNISVLNFTLIGVKKTDVIQCDYTSPLGYNIIDGKSLDIDLDGFNVKIPDFAFYRDVKLFLHYQADTHN